MNTPPQLSADKIISGAQPRPSHENCYNGLNAQYPHIHAPGRIESIDACRGFVMFIVVFQHVRAFGCGLNIDDGILSFIYTYFFLSTFFLLSGFLQSKLLGISSHKEAAKSVIHVFRGLIIPTFIFWSAHNLIALENESMGRWGFPGGYWFTYSLFTIEFFVILVAYCSNRLKMTLKNKTILLIIIGLIFLCIRLVLSSNLDHGIMLSLRVRAFCTYMLFFVLGLVIGVYRERVIKYISNAAFLNIQISVCTALLIVRYSFSSHLSSTITSAFDIIISIVATLTIFIIFVRFREYFESNATLPGYLRLFGRNSLCLYMLHYFFIPSIGSLAFLFSNSGNATLELIIIGIIAFTICIVSIAFGKILSISPLLGKLLFSNKSYDRRQTA